MCKEHILSFADCPHQSTILEECSKQGCTNRQRIEVPQDEGKCFDCIGEEPKRPAVYWKWCMQSTICDHEFGHVVTDVERDPDQEEVVLFDEVHDLCPDCKAEGLDERPSIWKASRIPDDFAGLPRTLSASMAPASASFASYRSSAMSASGIDRYNTFTTMPTSCDGAGSKRGTSSRSPFDTGLSESGRGSQVHGSQSSRFQVPSSKSFNAPGTMSTVRFGPSTSALTSKKSPDKQNINAGTSFPTELRSSRQSGLSKFSSARGMHPEKSSGPVDRSSTASCDGIMRSSTPATLERSASHNISDVGVKGPLSKSKKSCFLPNANGQSKSSRGPPLSRSVTSTEPNNSLTKSMLLEKKTMENTNSAKFRSSKPFLSENITEQSSASCGAAALTSLPSYRTLAGSSPGPTDFSTGSLPPVFQTIDPSVVRLRESQASRNAHRSRSNALSSTPGGRVKNRQGKEDLDDIREE